MTRIVLSGAVGKMGRMVAEMMAAEPQFEIVAGVDPFAAGAEAAFPLYERLDERVPPADMLIDFSRPDALPDVLAFCQNRHVPAVLATTGYGEAEDAAVRRASERIPIFRSANMSLGVNVLLDLCKEAASTLKGFDIEIVEAHHNTKIDSPSGTALMLAEGINRELMGERRFVFGRHTKTERRDPVEIGIHAIRGGTIAGEHDVRFMGQDETVILRHAAASRRIFAVGALRAAAYLVGKPAGLYAMQDLLFERPVNRLLADQEQTLLALRDLPGGVAAVSQLFSRLADENIVVDMISQTVPREGKIDLCFTVPRDKAVQAAAMCDTPAQSSITKITIEGPGMERQAGVAARALSRLADRGVSVLMITTSETKISLCVPAEQDGKAIAGLKEAFGLEA